jgi:hypothetical protein
MSLSRQSSTRVDLLCPKCGGAARVFVWPSRLSVVSCDVCMMRASDTLKCSVVEDLYEIQGEIASQKFLLRDVSDEESAFLVLLLCDYWIYEQDETI